MAGNPKAGSTAMDAYLYNEDFVLWAEQTAGLLRKRRFTELDLGNLIEEVEGLALSQKHELRSRLVVLILHLLKWQAQPQLRQRSSWGATISEQRVSLEDLLEFSPSLGRFAAGSVSVVYTRAVRRATLETRLPRNTWPDDCPFTLEQILDPGFLPE